MTTIIKTALGLGAVYLVCCIPEWVAPLITPGMFPVIFIIGLAGLLGCVLKWYREALEREAKEEGEQLWRSLRDLSR